MSREFYWDEPDPAGPRLQRSERSAEPPAEVTSLRGASSTEDDQAPGILATAVRAARLGGRRALECLDALPSVSEQRAREVAAAASDEIEAAIVGEIHSAYPAHSIVIREPGEMLNPDSRYVWLIEPLDGATNFGQCIPFFGLSIAFRHHSLYQVGVVYDPSTDDLFQAVFNRGAWLNDRPIYVEHVSEGVGAYQKAVLGTDWPSPSEERVQNVKIAALLGASTLAINLMGSPVLGLCYVAAGRLHGYWHLGLRLSQVAAAKVILDEAGGVLTNIQGASWLYTDGAYLATNGVIHGEMLRNIRAVLASDLHHRGTETQRLR